MLLLSFLLPWHFAALGNKGSAFLSPSAALYAPKKKRLLQMLFIILWPFLVHNSFVKWNNNNLLGGKYKLFALSIIIAAAEKLYQNATRYDDIKALISAFRGGLFFSFLCNLKKDSVSDLHTDPGSLKIATTDTARHRVGPLSSIYASPYITETTFVSYKYTCCLVDKS